MRALLIAGVFGPNSTPKLSNALFSAHKDALATAKKARNTAEFAKDAAFSAVGEVNKDNSDELASESVVAAGSTLVSAVSLYCFATSIVSATSAYNPDTYESVSGAVAVGAAADAVNQELPKTRTFDKSTWLEAAEDSVSVINGNVPRARKLWSSGNLFEPDPWPDTRTAWQDAGPGWKFWINWYESILDGPQMNPNMLQEIALIAPEDWDKGADHVNEIIAGIRLEYAELATSNAEDIEINPETGKLRAIARSSLPADHLAEAMDKLRDANGIFVGEGGANDMYASLLPERQIVDDAIERYSQRPMRLYDACRRASRRVQDKVTSGDCPDNDALINDYTRQLDEVAVDIRGFDEVVKDVTATRVLEAMKELPEEAFADFVQAADEVAESSEGYLAEELPVEARKAIDSELSEIERKEALNASTGRMIRALKAGRKHLTSTAGVVKDIRIVVGGATGVVGGVLYMTGKLPIILHWLLSLF
ncbi:MAG: hypothetical protein ACU0CA_07815 [Paracoccaceae bacterium]